MKKQKGEAILALTAFLLGVGFSGLIWSNGLAKEAETAQANQPPAIVAQK